MPTEAPHELALLGHAFALQQAGRFDEAEAAYARILAVSPDDVTALINGGALALSRGQVTVAIARFDRVVRQNPDNAMARNNLGLALIHAGRVVDALVHLDRAVALTPDYAQAHNNRGIALVRVGRAADAIGAFERAVALEPSYVEALRNLGEQSNAMGDGQRALDAFSRVLAIRPEDVTSRVGCGFAQALSGDLTGAANALEQTTHAYPEHAAAWQTLGAVHNWNWRHDDAERAFRVAATLDDDNADARFGIASTLLARGDYERGWAAFERRGARSLGTPEISQLPAWNGENLNGTLAVYGEQGYGDVVQFARFIASARTRVQRLVLLLDGYLEPLAPLLATLPSVDQVHTREQDVHNAAARISVLSLPYALGVRADVADRVRYLAPPSRRADEWCARMASYASPRIGLAWSVLARDAHAFVTRHKSVPVPVLMPLLARRDAEFFTLQPGVAGNPAALGSLADRIVDLRNHIGDFADTAALIDSLDLVISADTAVAHVAGALGKPVWMLDRFNTCWRWRQGGSASPWYPTMRIFRQASFGDWGSVKTALLRAFEVWRSTL